MLPSKMVRSLRETGVFELTDGSYIEHTMPGLVQRVYPSGHIHQLNGNQLVSILKAQKNIAPQPITVSHEKLTDYLVMKGALKLN